MSVINLLAGRNYCSPLSDGSNQTEKIPFRDVAVGAIFLLEVIVGALGNFSLLYHYLLLYCIEGRVRTIDFILMHLTVSNSLCILLIGVPKSMAGLGLKFFLSVIECHLMWYAHKVTRGMSIGCTCLLSVFQAIRTSFTDSCKVLKIKTPQYVTGSVSCCWILFVLVNFTFPMHLLYVSSKWSLKNITKQRDLGYCYIINDEHVTIPIYFTLVVSFEVFFSVLTVWANGSMIIFLHRHKKRVQYMHSQYVSSRTSAESRATLTIVVLMSSFLFLHTFFHFSYIFDCN